MSDDHAVVGLVEKVNDAQIAVTQAVITLPLPSHRFDSGHRQGIERQLLQLAPQLSLEPFV